MSRVQISELKAHLSEHLRAVRRGATVTILDRRTPIARIVPHTDRPALLKIRRAKRPFGGVSRPPPSGVSPEALARALEEERLGQR